MECVVIFRSEFISSYFQSGTYKPSLKREKNFCKWRSMIKCFLWTRRNFFSWPRNIWHWDAFSSELSSRLLRWYYQGWQRGSDSKRVNERFHLWLLISMDGSYTVVWNSLEWRLQSMNYEVENNNKGLSNIKWY